MEKNKLDELLKKPIWIQESDTKQEESPLFEEPNNLSGRQVLWKTLIWLTVGVVISILLFLLISFIWNLFSQALMIGSNSGSNSMLSLLIILIAFLVTFIGAFVIAGSYNIFFSKRYNNISKTFSLLLLTNAILFVFVVPIYFLFSSNVETLFFILWFHVLFAIFVSFLQIDFVNKPNYSGSTLVGNMFGLALAFFVYAIVRNSASAGSAENKVYLLLLFPPVLWYTLVTLGAGLWDKIYYKLYEIGTNPFYLPSEDSSVEKSSDWEDDDEVNVEY